MHRTQIYFEESLFEAIKKEAVRLGISVSAYIRDRMRQDLEKSRSPKPARDFSEFAGMWQGRDMDQKDLREAAWKR